MDASLPAEPTLEDKPAAVRFATRYEYLPPAIMRGDPMETAHLYEPFAITVEWRGGDTWCVSRGHGWSSNRVWDIGINDWTYEPIPSERDDDFLRRCRFSLMQAVAVADRLAS